MSDFAEAVLKGIQWPLLLLAVIGICSRIKNRKWTGFDTLLWAAFILFELFASLQVFVFYGLLQTSSRYLLPGIALYLPYAAMGVFALAAWQKKKPIRGLAAVAVLLVYCGVNFFNIYSPLIKEYTSSKHRKARLLTRDSARVIRNDWRRKNAGAVKEMRCDQYQSGRQPLVESDLARVGYFAGGQKLPEFLKFKGVAPAYIVSSSAVVPGGYDVLDSVSREGRTVFIYKRKELQDEL